MIKVLKTVLALVVILVATTSRAGALPAGSAEAKASVSTKAAGGNAKMTALSFPADKSMGKLWIVHVVDNAVKPGRTHLGVARGVVNVPTGTKLSLELSYRGAEDIAPIIELKPGVVVSLNCYNLDNMDDEKVVSLVKMPGLLQLNLEGTDVTDRCLPTIGRLEGLTDLNLASTGVTAAGVKPLKNLIALQCLHVDCVRLPGSSISFLAYLKHLKEFYAHRTGFSDISLNEILSCSELEHLNLAQNKFITDAGVAKLEGLHKLQYLNLSETGITKASFPHFVKMKSLLELVLTDNKIDDAEVQELRKHMPHCHITMRRQPRADVSTFAPLK